MPSDIDAPLALDQMPLDRESRRLVEVAAACEFAVLLTGESGTGKTCLARAIHERSRRRAEPFVAVNCAAIASSLFEREMFGHIKGAFTDAHSSAPGLVEAANRGTLFLDEISELPVSLQPKLLSVIEDRRLRRVGATTEVRLDLRLISATNRSLSAALKEKTFREDLFHRCSVLEHHVPSLRERDDFAAVLAWAIAAVSRDAARPVTLESDAWDVLAAYPWPGNIRELENALRHGVAYCRSHRIRAIDLPKRVRVLDARPREREAARDRYAAPSSPSSETALIRQVLAEEDGNKSRASKRLGMSRSTLWVRLRGLKEAEIAIDSDRPRDQHVL